MINTREIFHDTTKQFLWPPQADPGEAVEIRLRTGCGDGEAFSVDLIRCVTEREYGEEGIIYVRSAMRAADDSSAPDGGFRTWRVTVRLEEEPLLYFFELHTTTQKVSYDRLGVNFGERSPVFFRMIPGFHTPAWAEGAVMYQIFTDRFCNGDQTNDVLSGEYCYNGGLTKRVTDWEKAPSPDGGDIREFYGGDLQGVIDKLEYLRELGIQAIYFNPLFCSPSTHKYDTQDYFHIDPHFGRIITDRGDLLAEGEADNAKAARYISRIASADNLEASDALFALLVQKAHACGIRVILDGVFNHCGSFNKWMDRERIYERAEGYAPGAYADEKSPYHDYFTFTGGEWPCNERYEGWWNYGTLPKLNYEGSAKLQEEILAIAGKWVSPPYSADGWRLDVAADLGHSGEFNHAFWRRFRKVVKEANPEAVIIAEHYGDAGAWLSGGEWDSVMNYDAFMEPVSYFFTGMEKHSDAYEPGAIGNEARFWASISGCAVNFTGGSLYMAMNELSNHDHSRFLTRTNGKVGRSASLGADAAKEGVDKSVFREAVLLQMTWPGAPTVYYGDEAGVCGFTDPDNRRTYPWGHEDRELLNFHRDMIRIHRENEELVCGSLMRLDSQRGVIAYGRFLNGQASIVLINRNDYAVTDDYEVRLAGVPRSAVVRMLIMTSPKGYHTSAEERYVKKGLLTVTLARNTAMVFKYAPGYERDEENFRAHSRFRAYS
ncbi:MAG: glycoside hydrolase family 13 protein [Lachnospiraceae bacterium]|nr:glycoside hydrolase family 13 protein [Lachnospiraceae bacterium]